MTLTKIMSHRPQPGVIAALALALVLRGLSLPLAAADAGGAGTTQSGDAAGIEALLLLAQSADKAAGSENRRKVLEEFLRQSAPVARAHPEQTELWLRRASAALELNLPKVAREAAQPLQKVPAPDERVRKVLGQLARQGWTALAKIRTQLPPGPDAPKELSGRPLKVSDTGIKLRWIAPGSFKMGSSADNPGGRLVRMSRGYWMGETEVTQTQWESRMGLNPSSFCQQSRSAAQSAMTIVGDDRPVEQVSWVDAMNFCRSLTVSERAAGRVPAGYEYRLPTEAEWEYAARAGIVGDYPEKLGKLAWFDDNSDDITHDVAGKKANAWGLRDMAGNVAEWCYDRFQPLDDQESTDWAVLDPDPDDRKSANRIIRGGSWLNVASRCQPSYRVSDDQGNTLNYLGFRVVLAPCTDP
jgi:formylglycine-generating enzyme required for sulfatase activity